MSCLLQLFGASAVTKEYVLGVTDYSKATWGQNFIASIAGAVASITVAAPLDTVKTRIQNANFERKVHGMTVVKDLIKNEGPTAFFKGLTPKVSNSASPICCILLGSGACTLTRPVRVDPCRWPEISVQLYASAVIDTPVLQVGLSG